MSFGQSLGIQGVILGSFILAAFGWIVSANAAPLPSLSIQSKIPGEGNPEVELATSDGFLAAYGGKVEQDRRIKSYRTARKTATPQVIYLRLLLLLHPNSQMKCRGCRKQQREC
jgi:hypothetical protein